MVGGAHVFCTDITFRAVRAYALAYARIRAYTCGRVRAPSVRWGEIRRTSRCDTPYHYPRYAVSLFGVP